MPRTPARAFRSLALIALAAAASALSLARESAPNLRRSTRLCIYTVPALLVSNSSMNALRPPLPGQPVWRSTATGFTSNPGVASAWQHRASLHCAAPASSLGPVAGVGSGEAADGTEAADGAEAAGALSCPSRANQSNESYDTLPEHCATDPLLAPAVLLSPAARSPLSAPDSLSSVHALRPPLPGQPTWCLAAACVGFPANSAVASLYCASDAGSLGPEAGVGPAVAADGAETADGALLSSVLCEGVGRVGSGCRSCSPCRRLEDSEARGPTCPVVTPRVVGSTLRECDAGSTPGATLPVISASEQTGGDNRGVSTTQQPYGVAQWPPASAAAPRPCLGAPSHHGCCLTAHFDRAAQRQQSQLECQRPTCGTLPSEAVKLERTIPCGIYAANDDSLPPGSGSTSTDGVRAPGRGGAVLASPVPDNSDMDIFVGGTPVNETIASLFSCDASPSGLRRPPTRTRG